MKSLILWLFALSAHCAMAASIPLMGSHDPYRGQREVASDKLRSALPYIREGDVIFIRVCHALYRRIAETSGSWESHVGIILRAADGSWTVAESTIPVSRFTPLERFAGNPEASKA